MEYRRREVDRREPDSKSHKLEEAELKYDTLNRGINKFISILSHFSLEKETKDKINEFTRKIQKESNQDIDDVKRSDFSVGWGLMMGRNAAEIRMIKGRIALRRLERNNSDMQTVHALIEQRDEEGILDFLQKKEIKDIENTKEIVGPSKEEKIRVLEKLHNIEKSKLDYKILNRSINDSIKLLLDFELKKEERDQINEIIGNMRKEASEDIIDLEKSNNELFMMGESNVSKVRRDKASDRIALNKSNMQKIQALLEKSDIESIRVLLNYEENYDQYMRDRQNAEYEENIDHGDVGRHIQNMQGRGSMESVENMEHDQYMRDRQNMEYEENIDHGDVGRHIQNMQGRGSMESVENMEYEEYMRDRQNMEYEENMDNRHIDERSDLEMMMEAKRRRIDDILRHMPPEGLSRVYEFCVGKREEEEVPTPELDALPTSLRDIPRLFFPTSFEMKLEQQTKLNREQLVKHVATCFAHEGGALLYDMDYTLLDPRKSLKFRKKWISAMRIFQEINASNKDEKSQIRFGICSGRSLEEIQASFKITGSEALAVEPHMHKYGERGDVYRGPRSEGEKVLIRKELKKYTHFVERIRKDIISEIRKNNILSAYMAKGSIPQDINIKNNALGLSILDQGTEFFIENVQIATGKPMSANDLKEASRVLMEEMRKILSGVIKKYPDFEVEERLGFFIRLKESAAGQKLGKGAALQDLVDAYNLSSAFIIGDGEVDVEAAEKGYQLRRVNEFIDDYISNLPEKKMEFLKRFTESIEKYRSEERNAAEAKPEVELEINAEDNVVKERIRRKNKLHEGILRLNKRNLSKIGLIGVKRPKDIPESPNVAKKSMHVATGIDDVASLSYDIAIHTREIRKDIERQQKATQEKITQERLREERVRQTIIEGREREEIMRRMSGGEEGRIRVRATPQELAGILGMMSNPAIAANIQGMELRNPVTGELIGGLTPRRTTGRNPVNRENEDPNSADQPRIVELPDPNTDPEQS